MPEEEAGWRGCYRHPNRVAIRDCACCGRPICRDCENESGDNLLCLPCKQELKAIEEEKPAEQPGDLELRKGGERARLDLSDVTVFDDGRVIHPEPAGGAPPPAEEPEEEEGPEAEEQGPAEEEPEKIEEKAPIAEATGAGVAGGEIWEETKSWDVSNRPGDGAETAPVRRRAGAKRPPRPKKPKKPKRPEKEFVPGGPGKQLLYALPYAVLTAGVLTGIWLLVATLSRNWSQASAFSAGVAVPWVLYKSTMIKKHKGIRVWNEPPPAIAMSVVSGVILSAFIPLMEYCAFRIIGRGSDLLPWSDFMVRYFRPVDWFLLISGVVLAFLIPFVTGRGGAVRRPEFKKRKDED